jgi:hypothetical protein
MKSWSRGQSGQSRSGSVRVSLFVVGVRRFRPAHGLFAADLAFQRHQVDEVIGLAA